MLLTEEQINERLEEVKKIKFTLDSDPTSLGLNSLNVKIAEIQAQKDRISFLIMEAMRNASELEVLKETVQHQHDRQLDLFLATDPACLAAKSAEARNVIARTKMTDLVLKLHHEDISSIKGTWYLKTLQLVHSNLESANSNLSRQITVLQLGVNLGGNHGSMSDPNRGVVKDIKI